MTMNLLVYMHAFEPVIHVQGDTVIKLVDEHKHKAQIEQGKVDDCSCHTCLERAASQPTNQAERTSSPPENPRTTPQENAKTKKRKRKSAYGIFSKERTESVKRRWKDEYPDLSGHDLTRLATPKVQELWNALPQEEKDKYEKLAKDYNTSNNNEIHPAATDLEEARQSEERPDNNDAILHDVLPESEDDTQGA